MQGPTAFDRCVDISEDNVARAIVSQRMFRALLDRAAEVARPEEGGPKVLVALARLATKECNWLEGGLRIEIDGDDDRTTILVIAEQAHGHRERVFPEVNLAVPFDEFVRAVRLAPKLIQPLLARNEGSHLVLVATEAVRKTSMPPPPADIDEASAALMNPHLPASGKLPKLGHDRPSTKPTAPRMPAVHPDVHSKPTVARMAAIRLEDMPEARREDQADIDDAWADEDDKK